MKPNDKSTKADFTKFSEPHKVSEPARGPVEANPAKAYRKYRKRQHDDAVKYAKDLSKINKL